MSTPFPDVEAPDGRKRGLAMSAPLEPLYNALADASNALGDISGEYYYTSDLLAFRESIDKHIDEALGDIRSWQEAIEEI